MDFPKEFFEGEERDGFYIEPMMKKAWAAQLEVVQDVRKVCEKHGIQFFADYGTLLGTIRHKGFIPWDDDIDLCMKREDYRRFLKVANELPDGYRVINVHNEPDFREMVTRVVNRSKISFETKELEKFHGCPYAVGVDIFILDYMSPNPDEHELVRELIKIVLGAVPDIESGILTDEEQEILLDNIEKLCNVKINRSGNITNQLRVLGDNLCAMFREEEANEITSMVKNTNEPHYHMDKACYGSAIEMPFENTTLPVPVGYDTVLRLKYGPEYMTPRNQRAGHDYPFYRRQENMVKEKYGFVPE